MILGKPAKMLHILTRLSNFDWISLPTSFLDSGQGSTAAVPADVLLAFTLGVVDIPVREAVVIDDRTGRGSGHGRPCAGEQAWQCALQSAWCRVVNDHTSILSGAGYTRRCASDNFPVAQS